MTGWTEEKRQAQHERRVKSRMNHCVHFAGMLTGTCTAGVSYESVRDESVRPFRYPCYLNTPDTPPCSKAVYPTREDAEQDVSESDGSLKKIELVRRAIVDATENKVSISGTILCPVCGDGTVTFTRASNGHMHVACSTESCVRWME